ncbi:hypothetical protein WN944_026333 [Citrus x changshan-huyou]|uniref:Uncharacterized protein n=1 Tax=Citrus x changshan-huyou TaxID=2935761 RepID=A0AAP0QDU2_9ROSI
MTTYQSPHQAWTAGPGTTRQSLTASYNRTRSKMIFQIAYLARCAPNRSAKFWSWKTVSGLKLADAFGALLGFFHSLTITRI